MGAPQPVGPDVIEFALSEHYLGIKPGLSPLQRGVLKAIYGLDMTREERLAYLAASEGREPRKGGYREAAIIVGRRGGKSLLGAIIMTYECVRWGPVIAPLLQPGQVARGILIAQNLKQTGEIRSYIEGMIHSLEGPACGHECHWSGGILAQTQGQERAITGAEIKLRWPVSIGVFPPNKASTRGSTALCVVLDEIAHWDLGEGAYNQDTKIVRAVRPCLTTLSGIKPRLIMISSPDEEAGVLHDEWKERAANRACVVKCPSWEFNPTLDQDELDRAQEKDPEDFATEYGAEFRKPGGGNVFLAAEIVDQCVDRGRTTNPPKHSYEYTAQMDAGFKHDPFAFAIGHAESTPEGVRAVIDHVQRWVPPKKKGAHLDPDDIIPQMAEVLKAYGIDKIRGDQFSDVTLNNLLRACGIQFIEAPASNAESVEAFKNFRGGLRAGTVSLPDDPALILELKSLVKKTTAGGHVHISAPAGRNAHDDQANVVARIVSRLLPSFSLDLAALNAKAMPQRRLDWISEAERQKLDTYASVGPMDADSAFASIEGSIL